MKKRIDEIVIGKTPKRDEFYKIMENMGKYLSNFYENIIDDSNDLSKYNFSQNLGILLDKIQTVIISSTELLKSEKTIFSQKKNLQKDDKQQLIKAIEDQIAQNTATIDTLETINLPINEFYSEIKLFQNQKNFKKKLSQVESSLIEELFEVKKLTSISFYQLKKDLHIAQDSLQSTQNALEETKSEILKKKSEIENLENQKNELMSKYGTIQQELKTKLDTLESSKIKEQEETIENQKAEIKQLQKDIRKKLENLEKLENSKLALKEKLATLQEELKVKVQLSTLFLIPLD